jgi:hypothetical protein
MRNSGLYADRQPYRFVSVSKARLQVAAVALAVVGLTALTACASPDPTPSGGPDVSIDSQAQVWLCGQVISRGRAVPAVLHAYLPELSPVEHTSMSGYIYLLLTADCQKGTDYSLAPADAAAVVQRVDDPSGAAVVLVLRPVAKEFEISFGADSGHPEHLSIRLKEDN